MTRHHTIVFLCVLLPHMTACAHTQPLTPSLSVSRFHPLTNESHHARLHAMSQLSTLDSTIQCSWHSLPSCHTIWMRHGTRMNESWHTWDESRHSHLRVMSQFWTLDSTTKWLRDSLREHRTASLMTREFHVGDTIHLHVWRDSYLCDMTHWLPDPLAAHRTASSMTREIDMRHDSFTCVTRLLSVCDMTSWHMLHETFIRATRLIHACDMTHSLCRTR